MVKKYKNKANKYAKLTEPQAEFDFHNLGILSPDQIKELAENFLQACRIKGFNRVLIITGKGLHSKANEPVVKPVLLNYLPNLSYVQNVKQARRDRGGGGALEVMII